MLDMIGGLASILVWLVDQYDSHDSNGKSRSKHTIVGHSSLAQIDSHFLGQEYNA